MNDKILVAVAAIYAFGAASVTAERLSTHFADGRFAHRQPTLPVTTTKEDVRDSTQFCYLPSEPCESDHSAQKLI
jgi:hypothetical protein